MTLLQPVMGVLDEQVNQASSLLPSLPSLLRLHAVPGPTMYP